ncbi:hypothetical protein [Catenuloplanes indicus]|uniref:Uncharacterized protein n=1 Tax=Catenuloplanes indicus TaxID=137267 RepID=A0AAE3W0S7_9ACTN|nr:hypothetical protein [Catenuloplanes indicus]MDQ0367568.1 hypothetical protein [Catenuloplanes indicus]
MEDAEQEPPGRHNGNPGETGEHRSQMVIVHPDVFDDATVRAWLCHVPGSDVDPAVITIEVENLEMRARRTLTPGLTRAFINALMELRRLRRAGERRNLVDGHRAWCSRQENVGEPHRSRELEATEEHNGDVIRVWLAQGANRQEKLAAMAYVEMLTNDVLLEWPPLTVFQHHALLRRLASLLDQPYPSDAETLALPRST